MGLNRLFEGNPEISGWLKREVYIQRWIYWFALLITLGVGLYLGFSMGKDEGLQVGYSSGFAAACPEPASITEDSQPMTFSAFLDWAGQVELPPMGWALLVLLVLVIVK